MLNKNRWLAHVHDHANETGLHYCAKRNRAEIANLLIKSGAYVDMPDSAGRTPLYIAATANSVETVIVLLCAKAYCRRKSNSGKIAIQQTTNLRIKALLSRAMLLQTM